MSRASRTAAVLVALALVALALAGCASPGSRPTGTGPIVPPPPVAKPGASSACPASGVRLSAEESSGALGLRAMGVGLLNCGARSITLAGYPGVRLGDAEHDRLEVDVKHGVRAVAMIEELEAPPSRFTLRPGQSAVALLVWRGTTLGGPDRPVTATSLRLATIGGEPLHPVDLRGQTIDLGTTGRLAVSPWRPRADGAEPPPTRSARPSPLPLV